MHRGKRTFYITLQQTYSQNHYSIGDAKETDCPLSVFGRETAKMTIPLWDLIQLINAILHCSVLVHCTACRGARIELVIACPSQVFPVHSLQGRFAVRQQVSTNNWTTDGADTYKHLEISNSTAQPQNQHLNGGFSWATAGRDIYRAWTAALLCWNIFRSKTWTTKTTLECETNTPSHQRLNKFKTSLIKLV